MSLVSSGFVRPGRPRYHAAGLLIGLLAASPALSRAGDEPIPRTSSGRPELSGHYDISTLTPLQRSPELGERRYLTAEEVAALADREASLSEQLNQPSDPDRSAPPSGSDVGGYNWVFIDRGTGAMEIEGRYPTSILIDPPNGRFPTLTERGERRRKGLYPFSKENTGDAWWLDREVGPYDGPESLSIADRCVFSLEATIPVLPKLYNNVKRIVQTDSHVTILIEWMHEARIIELFDDEASALAHHAPDAIRSRSGDSVGWWEGDSLVVHTTNFLEESWITTTLFGEPSPPADQVTVERFTLLDKDHLLYRFTVASGDWEAPYTGEYTWPRTADRLYEYACHEGNYSMGNILRGARLLESEAAGDD